MAHAGPCPACGSTRVARILYGLPAFDDERLRRELDEGRVVLGGCVILPDAPELECRDCGHGWARGDRRARPERGQGST